MTGNIVDRLLASEEPSIRWKTRTGVLGESPTSPASRRLRREIRESPRVQALLAAREGRGPLGEGRDVYSKWYGTHWMIASLADLGYPPGDLALIPARDRLMERWLADGFYQEFETGSKAQAYRRRGVPIMRGRHRRCASQQSNALWSVLTLGIADERASDLVERLLHWQWPDGGWNCDRRPEAQSSSFMESVIPLRALALVARDTGQRDAAAAARRAVELFLERRLFRKRRDGSVIHRQFVALHYPLYWHYDILAGLVAMTEAGVLDDPRCRDALDLLESKRLPDGGWPAEGRYYKLSNELTNGTELVDWGGTSKRRTNEWVTVDALRVLQAAGRL
ncbi:MAG: hypothetical protein JRG82_09185 [Deltaproteobacteria bacterium]|nr:hypothetical protein [Deltaproteobacteria bacterium]